MLNNIGKVGLLISILIFTMLSIYSNENNTIVDGDAISKEFDMLEYKEIDLLDYISIESGTCYIYNNIAGTMANYIELYMFSSMGKVIYSIYGKEGQWKILKKEYAYKKPYDTEKQTLIETNLLVDDNGVFYYSSKQQQIKADEKDAKSILRLIDLIEEIKEDL